MSRPTILLNPGPVTLSERVRQALLREDQCHREPDFARFMLGIKQAIAGVYPEARDRFDAITITGSGTCAVEAMLSTFAPHDGLTLVVTNGVYGERMAAMLQAQGKPLEQIRAEWLQPMDLAALERRLEKGGITHVAAVHNETTTGRLNDIDTLIRLCERHGAGVLLDAVSSFGAEAIDFRQRSLLAVAATANKCLHGVPGIAFVLAERSLFRNGRSHANTLYLDLYRYEREQRSGFSPFTPAVHACFALHEALLELEEAGGWQARRRRYRHLSTTIRDRLAAMGIQRLLDEEDYSSMISSFLLPEGYSYPRLHDRLREAGFVIYAGQGDLSRTIFRIANMGDIRDEDVDRLLAAFERLLRA